MGILGKHIENKQISVDDIIRLSEMLEEYKKEWLYKAKKEEEYIGDIPEDKKVYENLSSEITYNIDFKDGRSTVEKEFNWFYSNLDELDLIKRISITFKLNYWDYKNSENKYDGIYNRMNVEVSINLLHEENSYFPLISLNIDSKNLDQESNIIHKQLISLKNDYEEVTTLNKNDILKFAKVLESYKKEWLEKAEIENKYISSLPSKKKQYDDLKAKIKYEITWNDGRSKEEESHDWFIENLKDYKNIEKISFRFYLSYYDNREKDYIRNSLDSWIYFETYEDNYNSKARFDVDSSNMEQEADVLHNKINEVFKDNDIRYDKTIKNRFIRIQAFSIAVGIILSYIIYIILKIVLKDADSYFVNLLNNKSVIVFGQWLLAIAAGNIFASWFINLLYKPLLPDKKYVKYDSKNHKSVYRDLVDEYMADSELQFGKFSDLKEKRKLIEKIFKYSSIVILVQVVISILLYIILK